MKKYKLLKDLPTFKAGQIFDLCNDGLWQLDDNDALVIMAYARATLDKFPNILGDWFEEIGKSEEANESKIWEPKLDRKYYNISDFGFISNSTNNGSQIDQFRIGIGNCFHTEEEAEKAIEKLEALRRLREKGLRFYDWSFDITDNNVTISASIEGGEAGSDYRVELVEDMTLLFRDREDYTLEELRLEAKK